MFDFKKIIFVIIILSLVACNMSKKKNVVTNVKTFKPFTIKYDKNKNYVVILNFNNKVINCENPCEVISAKNFLLIEKNKNLSLYNRKGEVLVSSPSTEKTVELTDSFAKVIDKTGSIIYSGFNGTKLIENVMSSSSIKITNKFLTVVSKGKLKIWNQFSQVLDEVKIEQETLRLYSTDYFVGYINNFKELTLFNVNGHKLANFRYKNKRPMRLKINEGFAYYSVGKKRSALYSRNGHMLIDFYSRPAQAIFMNDKVAGFSDVTNSASFWNQDGSYILTLLKEPGLKITNIESKLEYTSDKVTKPIHIN